MPAIKKKATKLVPPSKGKEQCSYTREQIWNNMYSQLVSYKETYGDCVVPRTYKRGTGTSLGNWVDRQRDRYKKKQLSESQVLRLKEIGFVFSLADTREYRSDTLWNNMYSQLVSYKETHGDCLVPQNTSLGSWVRKQRIKYDKKRLDDSQLLRLKEIGFVFHIRKIRLDKRNQVIWNHMYERLLSYKAIYCNCLVPKGYEDDKKLGIWVNHQRASYNNNKLPIDRINMLKAIGFEFNSNTLVKRTSFDDMLDRLVSYKEKYGNCLVPSRYEEDNIRLGPWVQLQRLSYKNNKLSNDRIDKLKSVGFEFNNAKHITPWNDMYERLVSYKETYGNCLVPKNYKEDAKLGRWVHRQRMHYKNNKLANDRIEKLKSIGFEFAVYKKEIINEKPWDVMHNV